MIERAQTRQRFMVGVTREQHCRGGALRDEIVGRGGEGCADRGLGLLKEFSACSLAR